jgi:hypothetical protein
MVTATVPLLKALHSDARPFLKRAFSNHLSLETEAGGNILDQ